MSSSKDLEDRTTRLRGFTYAIFGHATTVFFSNVDHIMYTDYEEDSPRVNSLRTGGEVTALCASSDHSLICYAAWESVFSTIRVLDSTTLTPLIDSTHQQRILAMCVSQGNEAMGALGLTEQLTVTLAAFDLKQNKLVASGELLPDEKSEYWQVSLCPADETVICCVGGNFAYLLRSLNGYIEKFSQIKFEDVLCHSWANDVTIAFGTENCSIRLYKETLALDVIDLADTFDTILNKDMPTCRVIAMTFTAHKFAALIQNGVLLVFPILNWNPSWISATAIVKCLQKLLKLTDSFLAKNEAKILSFDTTGDLILYSDGRKLQVSCLRRVLSYGRSEGAFLVFFSPQQHTLQVVHAEGITTYDVTYHELEAKEIFCSENVQYAVVNQSQTVVVLFHPESIETYNTLDLKQVCAQPTKFKKGVLKAVFTAEDEYLTVLTKNDHVSVFDGKTLHPLWNVSTKLQFYLDIAQLDDTVYAVNKKFAVTRLRAGKELEAQSMHNSAIGYQGSSHSLVAACGKIFLGTSCGQVLMATESKIEEPTVLLAHCQQCLAFLGIRQKNLVIGGENGTLLSIALEDGAEMAESEDFILCPFDRINNLMFLIKDISLERSLIRSEADQFISNYTQCKDSEVSKLKEDYEKSIKNMKVLVKKFEEQFEQSEADKHRTMNDQKRIYQEECSLQEIKNDNMMREQIKMSLREAEKHKNQLKKLESGFKTQQEELKQSFHLTEQTLLKQKTFLEQELTKSKVECTKHISVHEETLVKIEQLERAHREKEKTIRKKHREEIQMLEQELWNEKAAGAQMIVQRDRTENDLNKEKTSLMVAKEKIVEQEADIKTIQAKCNALLQELEAKKNQQQVMSSRFKQLQQNHNRQTAELQDQLIKNRKLVQRLQEFDARIAEISKVVYNAKFLEKAVLGLLAYMSEQARMEGTRF